MRSRSVRIGESACTSTTSGATAASVIGVKSFTVS
jgi:hypothetical protein